MRPVSRGTAPRTYTKHQDARNDLIQVIGWYCSYCEMPIKNMPEVEHELPVHHGGGVVDWDNFLLSCKYCNTVKSDHNTTLSGYFWPDTDNTFRAYLYHPYLPIEPVSTLSVQETSQAVAMIALCGLNREPGTSNLPTQRDNRWNSRREAWNKALLALEGWKKFKTHKRIPAYLKEEMAISITNQATAEGHFSIWMTIFEDDNEIRNRLIANFPGTASDCFDTDTVPIPRLNGNL
jgi:hypothetical protein